MAGVAVAFEDAKALAAIIVKGAIPQASCDAALVHMLLGLRAKICGEN